MNSHELAQLLLSMPDQPVRIHKLNFDYDLEWTEPVIGVNPNLARLNGKPTLVLTTGTDLNENKEELNPNRSSEIIKLEFKAKDGYNLPEWLDSYNGTAYNLYVMHHAHYIYDNSYSIDLTKVDIILTTGYDNVTWEPIQIIGSPQDVISYIREHYDLFISGEYPDIWYDVYAKGECDE